MSKHSEALKRLRKVKATDPVWQGVVKKKDEERKFLVELQERIRVANEVDPDAASVMGWRIWIWDEEKEILKSPIQLTEWYTEELRVADWSTSEVCRGRAGIHACLVTKDWKLSNYRSNKEIAELLPWIPGSGKNSRAIVIDGIVERFDRYVLGTTGWRTECAIIRKLRAPNTAIGLKLETKYPLAEVHHAHR